uniref:Hydroxylysine kinase n=1 Tax=Plectus sambesii TaxID=2011161 RepID=A0A914VIM0_9BILA
MYGKVEAQDLLAADVRAKGIPCAESIVRCDGKIWAHEQVTWIDPPDILPVRLLSFLSGAMLEKIGYSPEVYFALGALIADFHLATANFENATYRQHHPYLCLERTEDFLDEIDYQLSEQIIDQAKRDLLVNSISEFRTRFLAQRDRFEHGFIHSDFNETNVLLVRSGQDVQVTGLLDFGDSHYSCLVFDLVSAVLYMMLDRDRNDCEWWTIGAHLIAGYQSRRTLPTIDAQHILLAVRTRLCLSLAYGLRTARLKKREGGDCSYVLKTQSNGWEVLKILSEADEEEVGRRWEIK